MSPDGEPMLRSLGRAGFILVFGVIVYSTLVPIGLRPKTGHIHFERMFAFALLGAFATMSLPRRPLGILVALVLLAFGLEYLQTLIPTRDGRMLDAVEKSLGAALGVMFGLLTNQLERRRDSLADI